jgi:hypothetical protein
MRSRLATLRETRAEMVRQAEREIAVVTGRIIELEIALGERAVEEQLALPSGQPDVIAGRQSGTIAPAEETG